MLHGLEITVRDTSSNEVTVHHHRRFPIRLGRNELNDLHLAFGFVSQFHAVIEADHEQIVLRDLGSTNGSVVGGQRISGEAITLGRDEGAFMILALVIEVKRISMSQVSPAQARRAMNVTGLLKAPSPDLLAALQQASSVSLKNEEKAQLDQAYANYRSAWEQMRQTLQTSAVERPLSSHADFLSQISALYPAIRGEKDYQRMAEGSGVAVSDQTDSSYEERIALEGLKELFSEYVEGQVPPEGADELVHFLTQIRGLLDVFFKAYLPLRDGQRQFERDLGIVSQSFGNHPVEQATTPKMLSSILLGREQATEEPASVVEGTLADIMIHHVGMLNGVMRGVKNILAELSPESVKAYSEQLIARGGISKGFGGAHKALWQAFERRHDDLNGEDKELFGLLFGRQFSQAYQEATTTNDQEPRPVAQTAENSQQ